MKVQGPGKTNAPSKTSKKSGVSSSDESFGDFMAQETPSTASTAMTRTIASVDALLSVQSVEDPTARAAKKRMRQRGNDILAELDNIRLAMLTGNLTVGHMIDVADVVASHREKISDPVLTSIMDEIDLRAQVELAKMRVSMDKQKTSSL
jgi:hypothetical protein